MMTKTCKACGGSGKRHISYEPGCHDPFDDPLWEPCMYCCYQRYTVAQQTQMKLGTELTSKGGIVYYKASDGWWNKGTLQKIKQSDLRLTLTKITKGGFRRC